MCPSVFGLQILAQVISIDMETDAGIKLALYPYAIDGYRYLLFRLMFGAVL
jgi:hypothetical protein